MTSRPSAEMQKLLVELLPNLRAFAKSLCRNPDLADDLAQETLVKAWQRSESFVPGSNLKAWLFTILRNLYISEQRKRKYEIGDHDGSLTQRLSVKEAQSGHMDLKDFAKAFGMLPPDQREALVLIGAEGFSYEEVALMCGCAVGTVKSRVNRGRARLAAMLDIASGDESGAADFPQPRTKAS